MSDFIHTFKPTWTFFFCSHHFLTYDSHIGEVITHVADNDAKDINHVVIVFITIVLVESSRSNDLFQSSLASFMASLF